MTRLSGSCLCGAVSFAGDCDIQRIVNCHCMDCQKTTGSAFGTLVFVSEKQIELERHTTHFTHFSDSGNAMTKGFCRNCGVQILSTNSSHFGVVGIRAGCIDQKHLIQPEMNIFCASALASTAMDGSLPKFDRMPNNNNRTGN